MSTPNKFIAFDANNKDLVYKKEEDPEWIEAEKARKARAAEILGSIFRSSPTASGGSYATGTSYNYYSYTSTSTSG